MATDLIKSLKAIGTEKRALLKREQKLLAELNAALPQIGYRIVPMTDGQPSRRSAARPAMRAATLKSLVCPHCDRRFGLPLHLGRHMSVMHKGKKAFVPKTSPTANGPTPRNTTAAEAKPRRRMSPAARRAAGKRLKAYWRKRRAAERPKPSARTKRKHR